MTATDVQAPAGPSRMRRGAQQAGKSVRLLPAVGLFLLLLVGWEVYVQVSGINSLLLPPPSAVAESLWTDWQIYEPELLVTLREAVFGFLLATVVGIGLAIIITSTKVMRLAVYPLVIASQAVPIIAIAPLLILWFGFGETSKVLAAALVAFFPIVVGAAAGLDSLDSGAVSLMRSFPASRSQVFLKARLPNALPQIFSGLRVGAVLAVIGAIVGEFVGADQGLGLLLARANSMLQPVTVFACIVLLALLGMVLFLCVVVVEWLVLPWRRGGQR
ncbi:ABC transporter permease [Geodermatophilus sp. DF01-2]|uniref:ABC transporter permease n=1 Tax=Geodermatophilus sp. DF01-2 TaxID=2559610 RepID=UPI0010749886|nr:ABC transporter permease [Geodermatophilus sp. DF01_2]TFV59827.1 ABC transporter permease [Geodermatophilus sp. DF01_2]